MPQEARQILFVEKPTGPLTPQHFRAESVAMPAPAEGEVLVRSLYLSIDAANRAWLMGATYKDAVLPGAPMHGYALAVVEQSRSPGLEPGDLVEGEIGWRSHAAMPARKLTKVTPANPLSNRLSLLGIAGKTAYFGLLEIGRPKPGETILVSAAAGSVGSLVGQIGKIMGCRVVGTAGTDEKCAWLTGTLGFDAAINHRTERLSKALKAACPDGIDVYFDNTGGPILSAALFGMNLRGRIASCGNVSQYDVASPDPGPAGVPGLVTVKRLRLEGFIVMDFADQYQKAERQLARWAEEGRIKCREDIVDGLDQAPSALIGLLAGENRGKRMIRVSDLG